MKKSEFWVIVILMILAIAISIISIVIVNNKTGTSIGATGNVMDTGNVTANMDSIVTFTRSPATVGFGNISVGGTKTTGSDPAPFIINNTGTVKINMTILSNQSLFTGSNPTYAFNSSCYETSCATIVYGWTNFTQSAQDLVKVLEFNESKDELAVGILIVVPEDETPGSKSDTLIFTASEA